SAKGELRDSKDRLAQGLSEMQAVQSRRQREAEAIGQHEAAAQLERVRFQKVQTAEKSWFAAAQKAKQLQDDLEQLEAGSAALSELMERHKTDQQNLADLKLRLSEQSEARLKSAVLADPQLTPLQQRLEMFQRQANTAADSNLTDEAKRLSAQADAVRQQ